MGVVEIAFDDLDVGGTLGEGEGRRRGGFAGEGEDVEGGGLWAGKEGVD